MKQLIVFLGCVLLSGNLLAATPMQQSVGSFSNPNLNQQIKAQQSASNQEQQTFDKNQYMQLEQQIKTLSGVVQIQQNELQNFGKKMQGLEEMIQVLIKANAVVSNMGSAVGPLPVNTPVANVNIPSSTTVAASNPDATPQPATAMTDPQQQAFNDALKLMQNKQYAQATVDFNAYLQHYPQSSNAATAHFVLGELYMRSGETAQATEQFQDVVTSFPQATQVPAAMFKLAIIASAGNDFKKAKELFGEVSQKYPNSNSATMAKQQFQELTQAGY